MQKKIFKEKEDLSKEEKKRIKKLNQKKKKRVLFFFMIINIGLLCFFKYFHFILEQFNTLLSLFGRNFEDSYTIIAPLGISFYTFQIIGYVLDVYWEKIEAEDNLFKLLLFTTFFPQITQGPISSFKNLSDELFKYHSLNYKNFSYGFQRLLWGLYKKMIIANTLSVYVKDIFSNYTNYMGVTALIGAFLYSIQIYADFSGYMDIMCGYCEMLDIKLTENFMRPYFAKSLSDYWRRWHITLGVWFKSYIYYPMCMVKWNQKIGRYFIKKGKIHIAQNIPATLALVVVWFTTGFWHGASWSYILWGGLNGLVIIATMWMEPLYIRLKEIFKINDKTKVWGVFLVVKTFILVTFIKVLPAVGSLSDGIGLWMKIIFSNDFYHKEGKILLFLANYKNKVLGIEAFVIIGIIIMMVISIIEEKGLKFREVFNKLNYFFRVLILVGMVFAVLIWGVPTTWGAEGFMYANF